MKMALQRGEQTWNKFKSELFFLVFGTDTSDQFSRAESWSIRVLEHESRDMLSICTI